MAQSLINNEESFSIDKCEFCGFVAYNVITECPQCGNKILTGEKVDKAEWILGAAKEQLAANGDIRPS